MARCHRAQHYVMKPSLNSARQGDSGGRQTLLYIAGDATDRQSLEIRLGRAYDIVYAQSDRDVCAWLRRRAFYALLIDVKLADVGLSGIQLSQVVRGLALDFTLPMFASSLPQSARNVPILLLAETEASFLQALAKGSSQQTPDRNLEAALTKAGADKLLTKPVNSLQLSLALSDVRLRRMVTPAPTTVPSGKSPSATDSNLTGTERA